MKASARQRPVLLLAFANEHDGQRLTHLQNERRALQDALQPLEDQGLCQLVIEPSATLDDVTKRLIEYGDRLALFHFAGHAGPRTLRLETGDGGATDIFAAGFAKLLSCQRPPDIVFLNGCASAAQVKRLLDLDVLAVIGTTENIDDEVATRFSSLFYKQVAGGASVTRAFEFAKTYFRTRDGWNIERTVREAHRTDDQATQDWPWELHVRSQNAERAASWSLGALQNKATLSVDPVMLGFLCDRTEQISTFFDETLPAHRAEEPRRPLGLVLHGPSGEAHEEFVNRLQKWDLPRYLRRTGHPTGRIEMVSVDWRNNVQALRRGLALELTGTEDASLADIQNAIVETRSPLIVKTTVYLSDWKDNTSGVIDEWLALFAEFGDLPSDQILLPAVLLYEKPPSSSWLSKLRQSRAVKFVRRMRPPPSLPVSALPRLESVPRSTVIDEWLGRDFESQLADCAGDLSLPTEHVVTELRPHIRDMYDASGRDALPMEELGDGLANKIRTIFEGA